MSAAVPDQTCLSLDLSGKLCPEVVLELAVFLRDRPSGTVVEVTSTDPLSTIDIPLYALKNGHELTRLAGESTLFRFRVSVRPGSTPA